MSALSIPFHFTAAFLGTVAAAGGVWVAVSRPHLGAPSGWARGVFAMGWALVAAAAVLHGSFLEATDLGAAGVALRTAGYLLLAVSLIRRGPGEPATPAVLPAAAAFVPGAVALAAAGAALAASLPARRRLALALALFAGGEVTLAAGGAGGAAGPGVAWFASHGLSLGGGIALGAWLWTAFQGSVRLRFAAAFVALLLIVVVAISGAMTQVFAAGVRSDSLERVAREGELLQRRMFDRRDEAIVRARTVAGTDFVRLQVGGRRPELTDVARALQSPGGLYQDLDFMVFFASDGAILAYSAAAPQDASPNLDDADVVSLAGTAAVASALGGAEAGSVEPIGSAKLGVIASHPILAPPGFGPPGEPPQLVGAVAMGRVVDLDFLEALRGRQEVSILTRTGIVATTLRGAEELRRPVSGRIGREVFEQGRIVSAAADVDGREYFTAFVPLRRAEVDPIVVGALAVSQLSEVIERAERDVGRTLFVLALLATAVAVGASSVTGSRITRPLRELTAAARKIRQGDLTTQVRVESSDEVGALEEAFNQMTASLSRLTQDLRTAADEEFRLRNELETVVQSMTDGVIAVDASGSIVAFNREAERIVGVPVGEALGRQVEQVLRVADAAGTPIPLPLYGLGGGSDTGAVESGRDGEGMPVAVTSAPIRDDRGGVTGAVAIVRDLTREIEVERMKTEFLSNISHELRTPLTPIKGYADLLRRRELPRDQELRFLDSIMESTRRLERIVEMLVDFSAMEAGRLIARPVPMNVGGAVGALLEKWEGMTPDHSFERMGFGGLPALTVDARLLPRAVDELIDNAVKFSPDGGRVLVSAAYDRDGDGFVRLSVTDEGIGIPAGHLESIFQDFVQIDASETRQFGGLGLGLAYVRRIAEAHGGTLEVDSVEGTGSTFTLVLPRAVVAEGGAPPAGGPAEVPVPADVARGPAAKKPAAKKPAAKKPAAKKPAATPKKRSSRTSKGSITRRKT